MLAAPAPPHAVHLFGVTLVGLSRATALKFGYSVALIVVLWLLRRLARFVVRLAVRGRANESARFWTRQGINLAVAVLFIVGILSIWFDNATKLATGVGLVSAGLAFALQKAVTSVAGYFLILRGDMFGIGDRIVMGGVRGDVIGLGFLRTTILEMGQPPGDEDDTTPMWVSSRQYTGRIVTVTNGVVFDDPVYNYSRDFPYLWEEMRIPLKYDGDRHTAEKILLDVADRLTVDMSEMSHEALAKMRRRYFVPTAEMRPSVYYRLTDNWLEMTVRFVVPSHGIRKLKSDMSREILDRFERHDIEIASATYDIVGLPTVRLEDGRPRPARSNDHPDGDRPDGTGADGDWPQRGETVRPVSGTPAD